MNQEMMAACFGGESESRVPETDTIRGFNLKKNQSDCVGLTGSVFVAQLIGAVLLWRGRQFLVGIQTTELGTTSFG